MAWPSQYSITVNWTLIGEIIVKGSSILLGKASTKFDSSEVSSLYAPIPIIVKRFNKKDSGEFKKKYGSPLLVFS